MKCYSEERKSAAIAKMMPPENMSVPELSEQTGISLQTLYTWRQKASEKGLVVPGDRKNAEKWSSATKFAVVLETSSLNEAELGEYCRKKGLYAEQVEQWKQACERANGTTVQLSKAEKEREKASKKKIKNLERELRRKEAALAETAALLVLQKKARALWGESEDA
jgi:transposase-like protein